ncbi:hypothetical protein A3C89_00695 [Candidatus Kaiserbacteria bacterium RIFCSPHIGHO2_02_FULL_50_50]|uniref:HTH cro/C1-type domain-containing protein n=1 Tax=Candidatus Kaiserbacteria bacterium RIFCSPHIGHO2_02_FULL_50_50 TaxID=1798492 RepID=A0A1F6DG15_9BACT|nr:MAG: hypothetical protein A3C89_00695 [Candidatus Kaiserbacteria bacterium RIFCSPHIGHO2_02_FULL_50_50]OGG88870.1 MAG: hypothetical protein A3G62_03135 [Candidatus Kaiserbacteria bacterium RIFCSPLOWO2_12_FULL_50_10]
MAMSKKFQPKYKRMMERLRTARLEANMTQEEVGAKIKQPQAFVSKIERGERNVDAIEMAELAKLYKKSIDYFVG